MNYKVWICVESCDEEYDEYEDVDVPFEEVATLDTVSEALALASALQRYGAGLSLNQN